MSAATVPQSDEVALEEIAGLADRSGGLPGRNQLMVAFGWGASRASRLLDLYKDQSARTDGDRTAGPDGTEEEDQSGAPVQSSGAAGDADERSGPARSDANQAAGPTSADRPSGVPVRIRSAQDSTGGPDAVRDEEGTRLLGADPAPRAGAVQSPPAEQTGPDHPEADREDRSGPDAGQTGPVALPAPRPPARTTGEADQSAPAGRSAGPVRRSWGLLASVLLIAASAFVAIWGGWVGLGRMVGFGPVNLLPGIGSGLTVDLAITLPLGIEAYAAAAMYVAVGGLVTGAGRWFAAVSAGAALLLGAFGQATFHLLEVQGRTAPDWVVVFVSVLPVAVLGAAGVLLHLVMEQRKARR